MSHAPPRVREPSAEEIREMAAAFHITLTEEEVEDFVELVPEFMAAHQRLDELTEPGRERRHVRRDPGYRPGEGEDPYNVYVTKCRVEGREEGPLAGYRVGLKDNIALAGVEMTCGSKVLEGYYPATDATVVTRLLDAGATVTGKTSMEDMSYSGGGELCATGPVLNPRNTDYLAGGSSSGSAAAVAAGEVDVALGCDQGGSVRMPASFCGCVGYKPTYGLVPYTGIVGAGHTIDHVGPMASSVADCARVLDVVAGADELDPRQGRVPVDDYHGALTGDASDLAVGVLEEGFGFDTSEPAVDESVRAAVDAVEPDVDDVRDVSIPWHLDGLTLWTGIVLEATAALVRDEGVGHYGKGFYDEQFANAFGQARRTRADDFPPTLKLALVVGGYLAEEYRGHYHAKAQNLRRDLRRAYDEAFESVDVVAMPTTLTTALEREEGLDRTALVRRGLDMHVRNAAVANVTGHPAISIPCGTNEAGLPVGLMLVGRHGEDATVLRAADAFERTLDWESR